MTFYRSAIISTLAATFALALPASANVSQAEYVSMPAVDCVINPYRVVDISSPVAGIIEKLHVQRSQQVSAGEVVAQLEASVERANVELARYRAAVQSEIGLGQVNMSFDELRKERVNTLFEQQSVSRENADQVEREVQLSKWKLKQARELLEIRRLELRRAEQQLGQKSIRAPFNGFVLDTFKHHGEYVEEQAILRLAQLDPLVIEAIVPMQNFGSIETGMKAEIRPDVLVDENLVGTVTAVDLMGDTASNTFGVRLTMPNPENRIPAGLKCVVKFIERADEKVAGAASEADNGETSSGQIVRADTTALDRQKRSDPAGISPTGSSRAPDATGNMDETRIAALVADVEQRIEVMESVASALPQNAVDMPLQAAKTPTSYMVLIEQAETGEETQGIIDRLRQAGINDLLKIDYGANKGLISLGVFSTRAYAVNRQQVLDSLGFSSFTVERYR